jgi:aminomethyltransferase
MMTVAPATKTLLRTPLYALHCERGARMAAFAGYEMPIQYPLGVLKEHLHTREAAGLFDVSHMGQITLRPAAGELSALAGALERLVPVDVLGLAPGRERYALFTNAQGGIIDDLIIGRRNDRFLLIVNASRREVDWEHLRTNLAQVCSLENSTDRALLAVQGPAAEAVLTRLAAPVAGLRFMDIGELELAGIPCIVSRSGYTGEDGFEISVPAERAEKLARALLEHPEIALVGLGARDSLRTEAGLCLYGADIDEASTPVEAGLEWAIQKVRRRGGGRAGNFLGADRILDELDRGPRRCRVGLRPQGRVPVRNGALLFESDTNGEPIGVVTSGLYGPTVGAPVAMGYVAAAHALPGSQLAAEVRGQRVPVEVTTLPFVAHRYRR